MRPLIVALAFLTAIGTARAEDKTLAIGCALPLSGRMVGFGEPIEHGMELAVDMFNRSGQLPGAHFVLACSDSQGNPKETVNIAERLIDNKDVFISLSDFTSTATMAAADTYGRAGLVEMTPSASHPDLVKMNKWMFRASETVPTYIDPLADFTAKQLHKKRVAVIQVQTDWGQSVGETFIARLKKDGGEVAGNEVYNEGTSDFRAILTKLRRSKPDAIFLAMLEEEAANFMKQRKQLGLTEIPVIDSGVGVTDRSLQLAGDAFDGMYSSRLFNPERNTPEVHAFVSAFQAKYGKAPDIWSAYGYDAANIAMLAAKRAWPNVTRDAVREQLVKLGRYEGANGALAIDPETRDVIRYGLVPIRVENGKVNYAPKP
jgi:branched-chain amino acid transport system substrate-binding protein